MLDTDERPKISHVFFENQFIDKNLHKDEDYCKPMAKYLNTPISEYNVEKVKKRLKNNKITDTDGALNEIIKMRVITLMKYTPVLLIYTLLTIRLAGHRWSSGQLILFSTLQNCLINNVSFKTIKRSARIVLLRFTLPALHFICYSAAFYYSGTAFSYSCDIALFRQYFTSISPLFHQHFTNNYINNNNVNIMRMSSLHKFISVNNTLSSGVRIHDYIILPFHQH